MAVRRFGISRTRTLCTAQGMSSSAAVTVADPAPVPPNNSIRLETSPKSPVIIVGVIRQNRSGVSADECGQLKASAE